MARPSYTERLRSSPYSSVSSKIVVEWDCCLADCISDLLAYHGRKDHKKRGRYYRKDYRCEQRDGRKPDNFRGCGDEEILLYHRIYFFLSKFGIVTVGNMEL